MARVTIELDSLAEASDVFAGLQGLRERRAKERLRQAELGGDASPMTSEGYESLVAAASEQATRLFAAPPGEAFMEVGSLGEMLAVPDLQAPLDSEPMSVPGAGAAAGVVPPPPPPANEPERDAEGVAWDPAIHSANKTKNVDGTWRKRRGVDGPAPPPAAVPAPPPVTAAASWPQTVQELMPLVTRAMVAGALTPAAIGEACRSVGITALPDLAARPELIPAVCVALGVVS